MRRAVERPCFGHRVGKHPSSTRPAGCELSPAFENQPGAAAALSAMKQDPSSSGKTSILEASNEFLNREIQRLETERDAMRRELQRIQQSYAWRMIDGYRRWIACHRDNSVVRFYEKIALWILNRTVGNDEQDERKRYQLWLEAHKLTPERIESI